MKFQQGMAGAQIIKRRPLCGGRGLKCTAEVRIAEVRTSPPVRGAWVEIITLRRKWNA